MLTVNRPKRMTDIKYKVNNTLRTVFQRRSLISPTGDGGAQRHSTWMAWVKNSLVSLCAFRSCDTLLSFNRTLSEGSFTQWKESEIISLSGRQAKKNTGYCATLRG